MRREFHKISSTNNNDSQLIELRKNIKRYEKKFDERNNEIKQLHEKLTNVEYENTKLTKTLDARNDIFNKQLNDLATENGILEINFNNLNEKLHYAHSSLNDLNLVINQNESRLNE